MISNPAWRNRTASLRSEAGLQELYTTLRRWLRPAIAVIVSGCRPCRPAVTCQTARVI